MDRQEALERLKLIETLVNENRGSALENGKSWMWLGGCMSLVMLIGDAISRQWLPRSLKLALLLAMAVLLAYACWVEWRRYQRYRDNPTLAFKVYLGFMLGSFYVVVPLSILEARGLVSEELAISLFYGLMALSFAVFRPLLGFRWLDGFGLFWFAAACIYAWIPGLNPFLTTALVFLMGWCLPGFLLYRESQNAAS